MLKIEDLSVHYGHIHALKGVSLTVAPGETVALIGSNGAGKSTLLNAVSGLVKGDGGDILFAGKSLKGMKPNEIVKAGIIHCPEGRKVFGELTVYENILSGAYIRKDRAAIREDAQRLMKQFPRLLERKTQLANTMSGGEQQMLAICRSLMGRPKILLLDEPSMGLSPTMVAEVFNVIRQAAKEGITIMLVEQNANMALKLSDRAYILESGLIAGEGNSKELLLSDEVRKSYLGEV